MQRNESHDIFCRHDADLPSVRKEQTVVYMEMADEDEARLWDELAGLTGAAE